MPQSVKFTLAIALVIAAIIFGYYRYTQASPTYQAARLQAMETTASLAQAADAGMDMEDRRGPTDEERTKMREDMNAAIGLTPEQRTKLEEIDKQFKDNHTRESWQARHEAQDKVLTPEQKQKQGDFFQTQRANFQKSMQDRLAKRMKTLSPADQEAYKKKMAERRGNHGGRGGGPGGPGGPGGGTPPPVGVPPIPGGGNPPRVQ
ncbi:MAG: hypothetical protein NTX50_06460 [Candidatus Sumerlaeota bacterium]|nr:hypothetical protein [Candidatus Sumerlaeota bacterium]